MLPQVLGDVGILVFVDQDIAEPALVLVQHVAVRLEDRDDMQKKVAEVGGIQRAQPLLIGGVKLGPAVVVGRRFRRWHLFRRPGAVLPGVDQPGQLARGPAFFVDVGGGYQLLEQTDLVVGIQNREVRLQPRQLGVAAQDLDADRMEGAQPGHPFDHAAHQPADAVLHLARGLVGEGHGQDLVRPRPPRGQQMGDSRCQRARLPRPRARQHQDRAVQGLDRGALRGIQPVQIGRRARRHRLPRQRHGGREGVVFIVTVHAANLAAMARDGKFRSTIVRVACRQPMTNPSL